jgi:hypothetical protein
MHGDADTIDEEFTRAMSRKVAGTFTDPFGGIVHLSYDPSALLIALLEHFKAHPELSASGIAAYAKERNISPDDAKTELLKVYATGAAHTLNFGQLRPTLTQAFAVAADKVFLEVIYNERARLKEKALIKPKASRTAATNRVLRTHATLFKRSMKAAGPGQQSQWTAEKLARAVLDILSTIPEVENRTYSNVAAALKERFPDEAPESGSSLRKLVKRLGLNWKELKNGKYSSLIVSA